MRRVIALLVVLPLCATIMFSQTKRRARAAEVSLQPGYYFTVETCRACSYPQLKKDLVRLFQEQGVGASVYEGKMMEAPREAFAPVKIFARSGLWSDVVYVGPFSSAEEALGALDKFPSVLGHVQRKRSKMSGGEDAGWPLGADEKVERGPGNAYKYGFYEIKGCRLMK